MFNVHENLFSLSQTPEYITSLVHTWGVFFFLGWVLLYYLWSVIWLLVIHRIVTTCHVTCILMTDLHQTTPLPGSLWLNTFNIMRSRRFDLTWWLPLSWWIYVPYNPYLMAMHTGSTINKLTQHTRCQFADRVDVLLLIVLPQNFMISA